MCGITYNRSRGNRAIWGVLVDTAYHLLVLAALGSALLRCHNSARMKNPFLALVQRVVGSFATYWVPNAALVLEISTRPWLSGA